MKTYTAGQVVHFTTTFTSVSSGALIDPTSVEFSYAVDGGTVTHIVWNGALTALTVGSVAHTALGTFDVLIDTTGLAGEWALAWASTGAGQAVTIDSGRVDPNPLA